MSLACIDLDNTLVDRDRAFHRWAQEFVATHAIEDHDAVPFLIAADGGGHADKGEMFAAVRARFELAAPVEQLIAAFYDRFIAFIEPAPGAHEGLQRLRDAGWRLAIVTNGGPTQEDKIERTGLRELVDAVVVSSLVDVRKPDPRILEHAAERAGSSLEGAWVVGDTPTHDISAAARADLDSIWLSRGREWPEPGYEPTVTVEDFPEAVDVLIGRG